MFHNEFYPTNEKTLDLMMLDPEGKIILDPSAGSGSILDYALKLGAKKTFAIEITPELRSIVKGKHELIGSDFFDVKEEDISHVNAIYMNPPFSNAQKHILHAWQIAPEGCEIVAICNWETIHNSYSRERRQLDVLIRDYGYAQNLGSTFDDAERTTDAEIGMIKVFKPITSSSFNFDNYFIDEDEFQIEGEGIQKYDEVKALVNRYVGCMKQFDFLLESVESINYQLKAIGSSGIEMSLSRNETIMDKRSFSKSIQKQSWKYIFAKMNMEKYVTSNVMKDINKFTESQSNFPFTMKNIYKMFEAIVGTKEQTFNRALEEAIDNFTRHTHENRYAVEGWKSNSSYMLNEKFIVEGIMENSFGGFKVRYDSYNGRKINDLTKVLCNLTAENFSRILSKKVIESNGSESIKYGSGDVYNLNEFIGSIEPNKWFEFGFFNVKVFKKGTMHLKFKDKKHWYLLNQAYGKLKGFTLKENK